MYKPFDALTRVLELVSSVYQKLGTSHLWWRGHTEQRWNLDPKVYRGEYEEYDEYNFIWTFEQRAPVRYPNWPEDKAKRLTLMQHYGLPTRLLDWSFSLFTALYFSVCNKKKDDRNGSLWALHPQKLNSLQTGHAYVYHDKMKEAEELIDSAFQKVNEQQPTERILAMTGPQVDLRMLVQSGTFTIHGSRTPLNELADNEKFVAEIIIKQEEKESVREALALHGCSRSQLFPDLESLAKDIRGS